MTKTRTASNRRLLIAAALAFVALSIAGYFVNYRAPDDAFIDSLQQGWTAMSYTEREQICTGWADNPVGAQRILARDLSDNPGYSVTAIHDYLNAACDSYIPGWDG